MSTPEETTQVPTPAEVAAQLAAKGSGEQQTPQAPAETFPREYVEKLREEAKRRRESEQAKDQQLAELQAWKEEQERALLSEEDRKKLEWEELNSGKQAAENRAAEYQLRYEVALRAGQMGIRDPQDAVRLLDWDQLEFNEAGDVSNMDAVLGALLDAKPYLKTAGQAAITPVGDPSNASKDRSGGPALTLAQVKQMTPAEINARWDEVQAVLARGH